MATAAQAPFPSQFSSTTTSSPSHFTSNNNNNNNNNVLSPEEASLVIVTDSGPSNFIHNININNSSNNNNNQNLVAKREEEEEEVVVVEELIVMNTDPGPSSLTDNNEDNVVKNGENGGNLIENPEDPGLSNDGNVVFNGGSDSGSPNHHYHIRKKRLMENSEDRTDCSTASPLSSTLKTGSVAADLGATGPPQRKKRRGEDEILIADLASVNPHLANVIKSGANSPTAEIKQESEDDSNSNSQEAMSKNVKLQLDSPAARLRPRRAARSKDCYDSTSPLNYYYGSPAFSRANLSTLVADPPVRRLDFEAKKEIKQEKVEEEAAEQEEVEEEEGFEAVVEYDLDLSIFGNFYSPYLLSAGLTTSYCYVALKLLEKRPLRTVRLTLGEKQLSCPVLELICTDIDDRFQVDYLGGLLDVPNTELHKPLPSKACERSLTIYMVGSYAVRCDEMLARWPQAMQDKVEETRSKAANAPQTLTEAKQWLERAECQLAQTKQEVDCLRQVIEGKDTPCPKLSLDLKKKTKRLERQEQEVRKAKAEVKWAEENIDFTKEQAREAEESQRLYTDPVIQVFKIRTAQYRTSPRKPLTQDYSSMPTARYSTVSIIVDSALDDNWPEWHSGDGALTQDPFLDCIEHTPRDMATSSELWQPVVSITQHWPRLDDPNDLSATLHQQQPCYKREEILTSRTIKMHRNMEVPPVQQPPHQQQQQQIPSVEPTQPPISSPLRQTVSNHDSETDDDDDDDHYNNNEASNFYNNNNDDANNGDGNNEAFDTDNDEEEVRDAMVAVNDTSDTDDDDDGEVEFNLRISEHLK